jgi:hypothetical protein
MRHGRLCAVCVGESVDDLQRQSERALSEEIVIDIHKQTSILKKLATVAIDEEGARSLHDELGVLRKLATGAIDERWRAQLANSGTRGPPAPQLFPLPPGALHRRDGADRRRPRRRRPGRA